MSSREATAGFAHLDEKGRMQIAKPIREAFGLRAGSTVAWIKVGNGLMIIPQDQHLAQIMEDATLTLKRAGLTVEELLAGLEETRNEIVTEHYGEGYFDRLREIAAERDVAGLGTLDQYGALEPGTGAPYRLAHRPSRRTPRQSAHLNSSRGHRVGLPVLTLAARQQERSGASCRRAIMRMNAPVLGASVRRICCSGALPKHTGGASTNLNLLAPLLPHN